MPDFKKKPTPKQMQSAAYNLYGIGEKPKPSKPRKKPVQHETAFHQHCVRWFDIEFPELHYSLFHVPNERKTNQKQNKKGKWYSPEGNKLTKMGLRSGVADLIFCYQGRTIFIELKRPDGKGTQTENQQQFENHIKQQMFAYHIIDSFEDFQDLIRGIVK